MLNSDLWKMMPHLILEYSENIKPAQPLNTLFSPLHQLLAEKLPTPLSNCKSRCIPCPLFYVGDQRAENAFVHLTIKILAGRSDSLKQQLGHELLTMLNTFFTPENQDLHISFSVEILDLDAHYFKS